MYPDNDFKYEFFDETIAAFYKKEQDISRLLNWSAGLCIFISCPWLIGTGYLYHQYKDQGDRCAESAGRFGNTDRFLVIQRPGVAGVDRFRYRCATGLDGHE